MISGRFERTGSMDDIDRAIDVAGQAVDATPQDHPDRAAILLRLGSRLRRRIEQTDSMEDLNHAINVAGQVVDATPQDHPDRARRLNNLGNWLNMRLERTGSIDDLNGAINMVGQAVDITPQDCPDQAGFLSNLGNWLGNRFHLTGSMSDLNRAIDSIGQAIDAMPQGHPNQADGFSSFDYWLNIRFKETNSINDLSRAVDIASRAVDVTPQGHYRQADYLTNLGNNLGTRFEWTGSMDDLNRAVDIASQAIDAIPQDDPNRAICLSNLGMWLGKRFEQTGSIDDLNHAVDITSQAVNTTPQDRRARAIQSSNIGIWRNNLGIWLGMRFERTGSIIDINHAVDVTRQAVDATPRDDPKKAGYLNNLGNNLDIRFEKTGSMDDLNRTINVFDQALNITPQDHSSRTVYLNNLGNSLGTRFEKTGSIDDLNRAIDVTVQAVDATPQDNPYRAGRLNNLGNRLRTRFEQTYSRDDLDRALSSYIEGCRCHTASPSDRILSAEQAARILASQKDWERSSRLLQEAVKLLPTVSPRSLKHTDKQHMLASSSGLASSAAAISLNAGKDAFHALQLLELGRGVIASLLMDMRGDISDLKRKHASLADEFISLRDELDSPEERLTSPSFCDNIYSWELQAKRHREADRNFGELITRIRAQPGFDNFLCPPSEDELMAAANSGPIIIVNLSPYRCDAFLVERDRIRLLELPGLTVDEVQKRTLDLQLSRTEGSFHMATLLEWLWDTIARPSLDALGFKDPISDYNWPRVWWIPTGLLSQLPLHAAGYHMSSSRETVLDRVMSSYASSVKALINGRRHIRRSAGSLSNHALLVAMPETPDLHANKVLQFAVDEVETVKNLCLSLQLQPIRPTLRKDNVLQHLQTCRIFHFAGHGQSSPVEPSRSCLLLEDWKTNPLTVRDLRDRRLQDNAPFLSYLSACSTGANKVVQLADEGIHLVSAFQLAGFRHVVGTLWEVSDKHCVDVARVFYKTLQVEGMTDAAVCQGLHQAVRELRDGEIKGWKARDVKLVHTGTQAGGSMIPHWVPYIHFGV